MGRRFRVFLFVTIEISFSRMLVMCWATGWEYVQININELSVSIYASLEYSRRWLFFHRKRPGRTRSRLLDDDSRCFLSVSSNDFHPFYFLLFDVASYTQEILYFTIFALLGESWILNGIPWRFNPTEITFPSQHNFICFIRLGSFVGPSIVVGLNFGRSHKRYEPFRTLLLFSL